MSEIKELREAAGLTQRKAAHKLDVNQNTFGAWERGDRIPDYKTMDRIREELGELAGHPTAIVHQQAVETVTVTPVSAGFGSVGEKEEDLLLDKRFLEGTSVELDSCGFVRVIGSGLEPILGHRQIVLVEHTNRVVGDDIYVYLSGKDKGPSTAIISQVSDGLKIETRGPRPEVQTLEHLDGTQYRDSDGGERDIEIVGRVTAALSRPAREIAQVNEAARHARNDNCVPVA